MARIRTVKPEFWTDPALMECSLSARLLFIGMLNFADDEGNIEAHEKMIKVLVFPGDSVKIGPLITNLIEQNLLVPYVVNSRNYYHIRGFKKHQRIDHPSAPKCPLYEDSKRTTGGLAPERKGREGIVKEGKVRDNMYGEFKNVKLSDEEYKKLVEKFTEQGTKDRIENLSSYVASKGVRYKSHYATILTWEKRDEKGTGGQGTTPTGGRKAPKGKYAGRTKRLEGDSGGDKSG